MAITNLNNNFTCDLGLTGGMWQSWFPYYNDKLQTRVGLCMQGLQYNATFANKYLESDKNPCPDVYSLISCVQDGLPPQVQLAMTSGQVVLALAPTFISFISPTAGEISMLSAHRPILSILLALGSTSFHSVRFLKYDDPLAILDENSRKLQFPVEQVEKPKKRHTLYSIIEYILVFSAIANVLELANRLATQTVSVWKGNARYLVYLWTMFVLIPHGLSAIAFHFSNTMRGQRTRNPNEDGFWRTELTICAAQPPREYPPREDGYLRKKEPYWVVAVNLTASFMGYVLIIYGTMLFSSLLFIGPLDAFGVIGRYVGTILVCRLITTYELSGIRAVELSCKNRSNIPPAHENQAHDKPEDSSSSSEV